MLVYFSGNKISPDFSTKFSEFRWVSTASGSFSIDFEDSKLSAMYYKSFWLKIRLEFHLDIKLKVSNLKLNLAEPLPKRNCHWHCSGSWIFGNSFKFFSEYNKNLGYP